MAEYKIVLRRTKYQVLVSIEIPKTVGFLWWRKTMPAVHKWKPCDQYGLPIFNWMPDGKQKPLPLYDSIIEAEDAIHQFI